MAARAHVVVHGWVQGVFFRRSAVERARTRELRGWVRNRHDGCVEAVFEGEEEAVRSMVDWCAHGPPHATVERVEVDWQEPTGAEAPFRVAP